MSARFFQQSTPAENQSIKVNDITCRGHATVAEYLTVAEYMNVDGAIKVGSFIQHDNIPAANLIQGTSISTAIDATTVANPYNFCVNTFNATTAAGATDRFFINMKPGLLNSFGFSSVSAYFYTNVVGTGGIPVLSIVTQEADRVTVLLKNEDAANALNGSIHFRFKHELGLVA
jgi:hypothetical protein|tara:strand:+ start:3229 stop:3750 length:522 start_codon:yes stop_codon:yes gene_type:complete